MAGGGERGPGTGMSGPGSGACAVLSRTPFRRQQKGESREGSQPARPDRPDRIDLAGFFFFFPKRNVVEAEVSLFRLPRFRICHQKPGSEASR